MFIEESNYGRFANESFRQRLVRQRLRSIRQRPKSFRQRPTGQFANDRYKVLTKKKLLIDVWNAIQWSLSDSWVKIF